MLTAFQEKTDQTPGKCTHAWLDDIIVVSGGTNNGLEKTLSSKNFCRIWVTEQVKGNRIAPKTFMFET